MFLFKLIPILFIVIGVLNVLFPRASWFMKYGWQYKNAEPSQAALVFSRIGGVIAIIVGIYLLSSGI